MPSLDSSPDRFIIPTFSNRATCFLIHIERAVNQRKSRSRTWPCAHDGAGSKRKKTERRTGLSAVAARADRQHACSESVNVNYRGIGSRKGMIHGKRGFEDRGTAQTSFVCLWISFTFGLSVPRFEVCLIFDQRRDFTFDRVRMRGLIFIFMSLRGFV